MVSRPLPRLCRMQSTLIFLPLLSRLRNVVEKSVSQMKTMMSQVMRAVGVKETDQELTESQVEMSSEDDGFVQVRSRRKKKSKRSHKKHRRTRSTSASSVTSASEEDEGNTKQYAQKRFLAKDVKAKSVEDILLIGVKSIEKADEVYSHFSIENTVKVTAKSSTFVKSGRGTTRSGANVNKGETHCIPFNNYDGGCKGRCSYLHACYVCESKDHGKRDCPKKVNK